MGLFLYKDKFILAHNPYYKGDLMSKNYFSALVFIILISQIASAQTNNSYYSYIETDHIKLWYSLSNKIGQNQNGNSGLELKQLDNNTVMHSSNFLWGGFVNSKFTSGGTIYFRTNLLPGEFIYRDNPIAREAQNHSWKYSANWENISDPQKKEEYENGFYNWRTDLGVNFYDDDKNGLYNPRTSNDAPGNLETEMHWFVMNDMNFEKSNEYFLSNPIGLELQKTFSVFNWGEMMDVVFEKTIIINKGNNKVDSMYFCFFADNDLGDAGDDFVGVDTTLNLGYSYNSKNNDAVFGEAPPAVGHVILQSPIKTNSNRNISSFVPNYKNDHNWTYDFATYTELGQKEMYNLLRGRMNDGKYFVSQIDGQPTIFPFTGDPESKTGWFENTDYYAASDRRYHLNMGPITFNPGEKLTFYDAILVAKGSSNLNSVTKLKELAVKVINFYKSGEMITDIKSEETIPTNFELNQNYPNPFNPTTTIEISIPKEGYFSLDVYNILGEKVANLSDRYLQSGNHKYTFDASNLSSGVYFYRLTGNNINLIKKMVLVR
ncbi:MAG: T9SS type A sorting domain-containing protein [Melioribacteraceae bacterium]